MNRALFDKLDTFANKLNFIALELGVISKMAVKNLTEEQKYEIIEPYLGALIDSTKKMKNDQELGLYAKKDGLRNMFYAIDNGKKINAIKELRGLFRERYLNENGNVADKLYQGVIGLKEAKDEIERVTVIDGSTASGRLIVDYWEYEGVVIYDKSVDGDFYDLVN